MGGKDSGSSGRLEEGAIDVVEECYGGPVSVEGFPSLPTFYARTPDGRMKSVWRGTGVKSQRGREWIM